MNYLKKVEQFHNTFNAPVLLSPTLIDKKRAEFRIKLIQEELDELKEAVANDDLVEVADALADIQYVLSGTILEFGMKDIFNKMFDEVHQSNMSKACTSPGEVNETMKHYAAKGIKTHFLSSGSKSIIYRSEDDKILKSVFYYPANLRQFINKTETT
jgi:predicted HAD superfamily Cof-like phosphohydrolase